MANTTNFGWETPDDTDLVKDGAAAIRTLGSAIDTSLVDLKGGTTGQVLAKASDTDMDFTWASDATGIPATIFDAKGDLIAASAADTAARLAVGANGTVLTADSAEATGLKWATPAAPSFVGCSVYGSSQNIANNTNVTINWGSERFDTSSFHSTATDTNRITIPSGKSGYYQINAQVELPDGATSCIIYLRRNNTTDLATGQEDMERQTTPQINCIEYLSAGDYIDIYVYQASGSAKTAQLGYASGRFEVAYLGA